MFRYEVNYWDEFTDEPMFEKGFVGAETYGSAADKVAEYYGAKNVVDIKLYEIEGLITDTDINETWTAEEKK